MRELLDEQDADARPRDLLERRHEALHDDRRETRARARRRPSPSVATRAPARGRPSAAHHRRAATRARPARFELGEELERVGDALPCFAARESEYVATRRLSSTVRSGSSRRPSGTTATPACADPLGPPPRSGPRRRAAPAAGRRSTPADRRARASTCRRRSRRARSVTSPGGISSETSCTTVRPPRGTETLSTRSATRRGHVAHSVVLRAEVGADDVLVAEHLGRRSGGDQLAEVEHRRRVTASRDEGHVVVDEDHERPEPLGNRPDRPARGVPSPRPGARQPARPGARPAACRRPLAPTSTRRRAPALSTADLSLDSSPRGRRTREPRARRAVATSAVPPSARGSSRRCRTRTAARSPAPAGTSAAGPSAPGGSRPCAAGPRRMRGPRPVAGATNPLSTLKNVVLPAPFGPIRPQVPSTNETVMSSSGVTPPKRTVRPSTSITTAPPRLCATRLGDQPAELPHVPRELRDDALRRRHEHLQDADAEEDEQEVGVPSKEREPVVQQRRQELLKERGDDGSPHAEDPAHQHDGHQARPSRSSSHRRTGSCRASPRCPRRDRPRHRS